MIDLIQDAQAEMIAGGGSYSFTYRKSYDFDQKNTSTVTTTYKPGYKSWSAFGNKVEVSQINAIGSMFGG